MHEQSSARSDQSFPGAAPQRVEQADRLNALLLYDERMMYTNAVAEHVNSFWRYSKHRWHFCPAVGPLPHVPGIEFDPKRDIQLDVYDAVAVHYAVRQCVPGYFNECIASALERFRGLKILYIQDEYENTEVTRKAIERFGYDIVFTCVPEPYRELVYPAERFPKTTFLGTLTGFVPEQLSAAQYSLPMGQRQTRIAYRGRELHFVYGELGREKYRIGIDVRRLAAERSIPVDIEVGEGHRIYGDDWYRFLGSARATLGTESGSNVFDFDGTLRAGIDAALEARPDATFEEVHSKLLSQHEGIVRMNQVSPRIFESILLKTVLVLFEGEYSGVVEAGRHYIALKKDLSNIDEVFAKLEDAAYLEEMADRAYAEVVESGTYSYRRFIEGVDQILGERCADGPKFDILETPVVARSRATHEYQIVLPTHPSGFLVESLPLDAAFDRHTFVAGIRTPLRSVDPLPIKPRRSLGFRIARRFWRILPAGIRDPLRDAVLFRRK